MTDLYQEVILEEAKHPHHQGQLLDADQVLRQTNASCGDQVVIYLKLDPQTQTIRELKWEGQGCIISQAAMSLLAQLILSKNMSLAEVAELSQADIEGLLGIDEISPGRVKCLLLGLSALHQSYQASRKTI
jgi:nitrogen fixation NifU-like protein